MAVIRFWRRTQAATQQVPDTELPSLFATDPERAWDLFLDRHAGLMLSTLHHLGFGHDEAMDRFVYICEKLSEDSFRRLRSVRFAGQQGELTPWIRTVVKRLSVNWAWSVEGRLRLFKSIEALPELEQRVFQLYFWRGLPPPEVHQALRAEGRASLRLVEVFDALEAVFGHLNETQRWRLMSQLQRNRHPVPIAVPLARDDSETAVAFEPPAPHADPEAAFLEQEERREVHEALQGLAPRDRLILQLRFEEALTVGEVASIVSLSLSGVKASLRRSLGYLRSALTDPGSPGPSGKGGNPCPV